MKKNQLKLVKPTNYKPILFFILGFVLAIFFLSGCGPAEEGYKPIYRECVLVKTGFYRGCVGTVLAYRSFQGYQIYGTCPNVKDPVQFQAFYQDLAPYNKCGVIK